MRTSETIMATLEAKINLAERLTDWHAATPEAVKTALIELYTSGKRVRIYFGHTSNGTAFLEEHDIIGRIGRSTGPKPVMLLIEGRKTGGAAILDYCVVAIQDANTRQFIYKHHKFNVPALVCRPIQPENSCLGFTHEVVKPHSDNGETTPEPELIARFHTEKKARAYIDFMYGRTMKG